MYSSTTAISDVQRQISGRENYTSVGRGQKKKEKREGGVFILLHLLRCTSYFPHLFQASFLAARESSFTLSPTQGKTSWFFLSAPFGSLFALAACSVANAGTRTPKQCHRTDHDIPALSWTNSSIQEFWMHAVVIQQPLPLLQQKVAAHLLPEKLILYLYQYFFSYQSQRDFTGMVSNLLDKHPMSLWDLKLCISCK